MAACFLTKLSKAFFFFFSMEVSMQSTMSNSHYFSFVVEKMGAYDYNNSMVSDIGESKFNSSPAQLSGANNLSPWTPDSYNSSFSSSNYRQQTLSSETNVRRSRPSFLDSINISRGPSASPPMSGPNVEVFGSKVYPEDTLGSYPAQNSTQSSVALGNGADMFKQVMDKSLDNRQELYPRKQDEDFAALEQVFRVFFPLFCIAENYLIYTFLCGRSFSFYFVFLGYAAIAILSNHFLFKTGYIKGRSYWKA